MKEYKLCYVEGNKAWFSDNFENQWGDDWNDRPYECNAEVPYISWSEEIGEDEKGKPIYKEHKIKHKTLYFETEDWMDERPCDIGRFSVEDINKQAVAWVHTSEFNILAGTTYEEFIDIIEKAWWNNIFAKGGRIMYLICNVGCDDITYTEIHLSPYEYRVLEKIAIENNKTGGGCKPVIEIYSEYEKKDGFYDYNYKDNLVPREE